MKVNKIILFDAPQFASDRDTVTMEHNPDSDYFYRIGFSGLIAGTVRDKLPGYEIEIWRIDNRVKEIRTRVINDLRCKIYPLKYFLTKSLPCNLNLIRDLKTNSESYNLLIVFAGIHSFFFLLVAALIKSTPIICVQLGGANPYFRFYKTHSFKSLVFTWFEKLVYKNRLSHAYVFTAAEKDYLSKIIPLKKISEFPVLPIDLNFFKPIDKNSARAYLNLPFDSKIIYQTGRAFYNKGASVTIDIWSNYLKEHGIKLILTGIHESDELFQKVKNSGADYHGVVPREDLPYWYSAADVYISPPFDEETLKFGGYGYAPLEALACGTPLVCTTMINFPEFAKNENRIKEVCVIPANEEDVANGVLRLLHSPPSEEKCRALVTEYFTKEKIADNFAKTILDIQKMRT